MVITTFSARYFHNPRNFEVMIKIAEKILSKEKSEEIDLSEINCLKKFLRKTFNDRSPVNDVLIQMQKFFTNTSAVAFAKNLHLHSEYFCAYIFLT